MSPRDPTNLHAVTIVLGKEQQPEGPGHRDQFKIMHTKMPETRSPKAESIKLGKNAMLANTRRMICAV